MGGHQRPPAVVVAIIDGLPVDLLASELPNLPFLRERTPFAGEAVSCFPSTTGPAYFPFLEQLAALASGAIACVAGFAAARSWPPLAAIAICAVAVGVSVAVRPRFLGRLAQGLLAARGIEIPALLRGRSLALVIAVNALGWLATGAGAGAWTLVHALSERETPGLGWLIGAYAFAWLLGFLVPLLPGGLGLRDGTLVVLLTSHFGTGVATALALGLRLANTVGELVAIGFVELVYRIWRRFRPRLPELWLEQEAA